MGDLKSKNYCIYNLFFKSFTSVVYLVMPNVNSKETL